MKQLKLFNDKQEKFYGGETIKGKRKGARPLCKKSFTHLVLKADRQAKPELNLFAHREYIEAKVRCYAAANGITIYSMSVQIDHVHIAMRTANRDLYNRFIRSLTGVLARTFGKGIWKVRPFTRIGSWGRDFAGVKEYILQNEKEVRGEAPYKPRVDRYRRHKCGQ